jgi:hypothetical protein
MSNPLGVTVSLRLRRARKMTNTEKILHQVTPDFRMSEPELTYHRGRLYRARLCEELKLTPFLLVAPIHFLMGAPDWVPQYRWSKPD